MRQKVFLALSSAFFVTAAASSLAAIDGPVGRDAEKGDPARWYQPADTPQRKHEAAMKEAAAALAEALKECRAQPEQRKQCESEARGRHKNDVERARGFLVRSTLG
jgi:hypothetical protein